MLSAMQRRWWVLVLRGLFSIIFGILVIVWPGLALSSLILLVAAYFLVDGVVNVVTSIQHRATNPQWLWGVWKVWSVCWQVLAHFYGPA